MPSLKSLLLLGASLAATSVQASPIQSLDFSGTSLAPRADPSLTGYLGAFFLGADPYVYLYLSNGNNPTSFRALNSGSPVIRPTKGTGGVRDPAIVVGGGAEKGKKWYIVGTDLDIAKTTWDAAQRQGSKGIFVWESTDLVNWSNERLVVVENSSAGMVWAPEAIWDAAKGQYLVHWASKFYPASDPNHTGSPGAIVIRYAYTSDFKTFSTPQTYIDKSPTNIIDLNILPTGTDGKSFVRFLKDESLKTVFVEVSTTGLFGTWTRPGGSSAVIASGVEGPASYWDNQVAGKAHVLLDFYGDDGYRPYETTNVATHVSVVSDAILPPSDGHSRIFSMESSQTDSLSADEHLLPIPSSKLWLWEESWRWDERIWVAYGTEIPVPSHIQSRLEEIREETLINLKETQNEMMEKQAKETSYHKQRPTRRNLHVEIRMSGHQKRLKRTVIISPCIWILCGSKEFRDMVRKALKGGLAGSIARNLSSSRVEIHAKAPEFNATEAFIPLPQLRRDMEKGLGLRYGEMTIIHHVEADQRTNRYSSACGLLCCSTILKENKLIGQRISRVGGLLANGFESFNNIDVPIAMTTSHGIFDYIRQDDNTASPLMDVTSFSFESNLPRNINDFITVSASESDSDSSSDDDGRGSDDGDAQSIQLAWREEQSLGKRDPATVYKWMAIEEVVGLKFAKQRFPGGPLDSSEPSDYALLTSTDLAEFRNATSWQNPASGRFPDEITSSLKNDQLTEGALLMVFAKGEVKEAMLLPGISTMPSARGDHLTVRRIQLSAPLGTKFTRHANDYRY
ncbi:hypothetical protein HER10_EVM0000292 [Colletotrichum scovillei]|uniref:uncharacterized protein n=1 Tax=Colletotrichum scovillei TaxID=1209932 RepID=UPI0015C325F4|nr:uncharacterized protein HER10_EVM0000292 [Colletotrichum scovillei]KAF4784900.1 hypothetical protein HER10_EVM0000292 [Colletotrichum scovillei]